MSRAEGAFFLTGERVERRLAAILAGDPLLGRDYQFSHHSARGWDFVIPTED